MTEPTRTAPWISRQIRTLLSRRGHAWLLQGPSGLGHYELGLALVAAWLCETPQPDGACGHCPSCHGISVRTHADLAVLMPETVQIALGWPLSQKAQSEIDEKKRKPSKEIRVEALREVVEFAQRTDARGHGKAVLVYPAERMNLYAANTLLKTLEEPAGHVRFVLATESAHQLLPTLRSRCQSHGLLWPQPQEALQWLHNQGIADTEAPYLLRISGGRPDDALAQSRMGLTMHWWSGLPKAMLQGQAAYLADLAPAQAIDALQKLCHDLVLRQSGAAPRFFTEVQLPACEATLETLTGWFKRLVQSARSAEHPFHTALMLEALANDAQTTLTSRT